MVKNMKQLDPGFIAEVDNIERDSWHDLVLKFDDASFFQTLSYGSIKWGEENLSHLVLKRSDEVVSLAQLRIMELPFFRAGFAYITWGPLWKKKDEKNNILHLQNMLKALYNEYVIRRKYLLRILPKVIYDDEGKIFNIYKEENFSFSHDPLIPVIIDMALPLDEFRKNLRRKWRQTLNQAEKEKFDFIEGSDDELCEMAIEIIKEMKHRKKFIEFGTQEEIISIHRDLPFKLKLHLALCKYDNESIAVLGWSKIGKTGQLLVAATGTKALKLRAAYTLYWKMAEYFKNHGHVCFDIGSINIKRNPGGYLFKTGLAGKKWTEKKYFGQFDACENHISMICFKTGMSLRSFYRNTIIKLKSLFR